MSNTAPIPLTINPENQLSAVRALAQAVNLLKGGAGALNRAASIGELIDAGVLGASADGKVQVGQSIQNIDAKVGKVDGKVNAAATGISELTSRVTDHDGVLQEQSRNLTQLTAQLTGMTGDLAGLQALSTATQELLAQVTLDVNGNLEALAQATTDLSSGLAFQGGQLPEFADGISANANAIETLDTRVTTAEGTITADASRITALESTVNDPTNGVVATASALSTLTTTVTDQGGDISANATAISSLNTTVSGHTATITTQQSSINGLLANYSLSLDVNGYITGFEFNNDGTTGAMTIRADTFSIVDPLATNSLTWSSGVLQAARSGRSLYMGAGFAAPGYTLWAGPTPGAPVTGATDAAADFYVKTNGDAYFGGTLSAAKVVEKQVYTAPANGANMLPNATFTQYLLGETVGAIGLNNKLITDGWVAFRQEGASAGTSYIQANAGSIRCQVGGTTVTVPASGIVAPQARTATPIAVEPGAVYSTNFYANYSYNGGLTAGITAAARMTIIWYDGSGAQISVATPLSVSRGAASGWAGWFDITAPSTAATAHVFLDVLVSNANGAATVAGTSSVALQANFLAAVMAKKSLLAVAGSGVQIGDSRNLLPLIVANGQAKVPTAPTFTASAGTPATATISVPAWTLLSGSWTKSYGAKSVGVTGSNGTTVTFYLYLDDPTFSGTGTLVATSNGNTVFQADGRFYLGSISVVFPSSGTSSGGGSPGGGGNACVCIDMALAEGLLAADAAQGLVIDCVDLPVSDVPFRRAIGAVRFATAECVRLETDGGAVLDLANDTPFDLLDGRTASASMMFGEVVVTDHGLETVICVTPLGVRDVARISVGGVSYAAGRDPRHRIFSHNLSKP